MDWNIIRLIWTLELRTLLRSRRTIVLSVLLPILVMPLMLMATRFSTEFQERQQSSRIYSYAITGDWSDPVRLLIESAANGLENDPDSELQGFQYEETSASDPVASVRSGEIDFYLETFSPERADLEWDQAVAEALRSRRLPGSSDGSTAFRVSGSSCRAIAPSQRLAPGGWGRSSHTDAESSLVAASGRRDSISSSRTYSPRAMSMWLQTPKLPACSSDGS